MERRLQPARPPLPTPRRIMRILTTLARSDSFRFSLGGICGGAVAWALALSHTHLALIALPVAFLVGGFSCFICEHLTEAIIKLLFLALPTYLLIRLYPGVLARNLAWWQISIIAMPLGFFAGMGTGSLLGGLCRLCWDTPHDSKSP